MTPPHAVEAQRPADQTRGQGDLVVDLFAGPGGWEEGARIAGYTGEIIGIELDDDACATAEAAGHRRIKADVAAYDPAEFGDVDGLIASPPCQDFSHAGKRAGVTADRGALVWQPRRWAIALRPRWVALEQVPDVLPIWQIIAAELREHGYTAWTGCLNSADYGVPQTRIRAVLVARRDGVAQPPQPTHAKRADDDLFSSNMQPWVSMASALGWTRPGWRFLGAGPASVRTAGASPRTMREPAHTITGKATAAWVFDRPATTVCGDPRIGRPGHKARDKGERQFDRDSVQVSVEEAAVLQSFRRDYPWCGDTKKSKHQQIGNAVPPLLAAAILRPLLVTAAEVAA